MALKRQSANGVDFGISEPVIPVAVWQGSSVNRFQVDGVLTLNGQPVAGALIKANQYLLPKPTGAHGEFSIRRDQTVVERTVLRVTDASSATIGGVAATSADAEALAAAEFSIETAFTMHLDDIPALTSGQTNVVLSGVALFADESTPIPPVALWGYSLSGVIYDTEGKPLSGVYASIRDDEGETWAVSNETGEDGVYQLRFFPSGAESDFTARIAYGQNAAESEGGLSFEGDTSSQLDFVLDAETNTVTGTGANGAFEPTAVAGAEYVGYLVGLAVDDQPIDAMLTWPDDTGRVTVTIPDVNFSGEASFFQERVRFFSSVENVPGSDVPAELIPAKLDPLTPRNIPPSFSIGA